MKKTMNQSLLKVIVICIIIQLASITAGVSQSKADIIDKLMSKYLEYGQFNGSVLVAEQGKIIFKKGYGMANMEWDIPNQSTTKFRLGSISKQFTSLLILQLAEQGKLKLDVPITTYLPDYPKPNGEKITIHHLLTHTSGIPNYTAFPDFMKDKSRNPYTPEEFVKTFADLKLEFEPGKKFNYSNSGYFLLGYIIEKVSGKMYEQCLHESILIPLKMTNTGYDHSELIIKNRAAGYEKNGKGFMNARYIDMTIPYAAGSLYSTVEDLYLWDQALYANTLLSSNYTNMLYGSYFPELKSNYGYGWGMYEVSIAGNNEKLKVIEHGGGINGFNTLISRIPSGKNLIILLNNTGGAALGEMNKAIRSILYDKPYDMPKLSLAAALYDVIIEKGLVIGLEKLKEFKKSEKYALKEEEINTAGYQLLQSGKVKEAIEVFKLNVDAFPTSGNSYDSLGEAYLKDGNKQLAIVNYKKAVELDPSNENAKKVLEEISK